MEKSFSDKIKSLPKEIFTSETVSIRPIEDDADIWYAVVECKVTPEQEKNVSPCGFFLGRAYLNPRNYVPCVICKSDGERIGCITLETWIEENSGFCWSYYIDRRFQGQGYGRAAAELAVRILKAADPCMPVKLAVVPDNIKAQELYKSLGFEKSDEMDGDDWVYVL